MLGNKPASDVLDDPLTRNWWVVTPAAGNSAGPGQLSGPVEVRILNLGPAASAGGPESGPPPRRPETHQQDAGEQEDNDDSGHCGRRALERERRDWPSKDG